MDEPKPDTIVWVRRQWNSTYRAAYRWADIKGWHWDTHSGGMNATSVSAKSPYPMMYAYAQCDAMVDGELAHSCLHGPPPHRILVCLVQKDNARDVIKAAKAEAGTPPARPPRDPTKPRRKRYRVTYG